MAPPAVYAYVAALPNGLIAREIRRNQLVCAVASRVRNLWRVEMWSTTRVNADRYAREWTQRMHVSALGTKLKPKDFEARVVPVTVTEVPQAQWVKAIYGGMLFRTRYFPAWAQHRPLCVVLGGETGTGWKAVGWPTTDLERDLMVFRAKQLFPRVEIAPCIGPQAGG